MNAVAWFEIYVSDMSRAKAFYESVLCVELDKLESPMGDSMQMMAFAGDMQGYGAAGSLVQMEGVPPGVGGTLVYFGCEDCATEESRVESAGGRVVQAKFPIGEFGFVSMIEDTEGNIVGLHSMK